MLGEKLLLIGICCSKGGFGIGGGNNNILTSLAEGIGLSRGTLGGMNLSPLLFPMLLLVLTELSIFGIFESSGLRSD